MHFISFLGVEVEKYEPIHDQKFNDCNIHWIDNRLDI